MNDQEVAALVREVLAGNSPAYGRLVREYGLVVRSFIHARVRNREDAEDLAQETFIAGFRGLGKFDPTQSFEAWLIGIARHRVLGHFRANDRRNQAHERFREECLARIGRELREAEMEISGDPLRRLMDCVEKLPERMRQVIRARLRGEEGARVAELLEISRGAVYMLQLRANEHLKQCMLKEGI
jgi:RNA polymerase sigma-70 factor, ECF subfamily